MIPFIETKSIAIHILRRILLAFHRYNPCWNPCHNSIVANIMRYDSICSHNNIVADFYITDYFSPSKYHDIVPNFRDQGLTILTNLTNCNTLQYQAILANNRC